MDFPSRIILHNPFLSKPLVSYGLIVYCKKTQRWLLVKPRYSPEFILFVRGSYRKSDLERLIMGFTINEKELMQNIIDNPEYFVTVFYKVIWGNNKDFEYAWKRCVDALDHVQEILNNKSLFKNKSCNDLLDKKLLDDVQLSTKDNGLWLWPKGRLSHTNELPFHCAVREFQEETGLKIPHSAQLVSEEPLIESYHGNNGKTYETQCWVYIFADELIPPPITDLHKPGEIGDRQWVIEDEAKTLLRESKFAVLQKAKELIEITMEKS